MATGSKSGRSYSDQSYGSMKVAQFAFTGSGGTRPTAVVSTFTPMNPITVVDWQMTNTVLGTGGSSQWVLAATSASGTAALGTIIFVGTHAANVTIEGSVATERTVDTAGSLNLYSVLSTADPNLAFTTKFSYREAFQVSDN